MSPIAYKSFRSIGHKYLMFLKVVELRVVMLSFHFSRFTQKRDSLENPARHRRDVLLVLLYLYHYDGEHAC